MSTLIHEISKKDLYVVENGERTLIAKRVSELIFPYPDQKGIVYIEEADSHDRGQRLMRKETGKQPECIEQNVQIHGTTSDMKSVLFSSKKQDKPKDLYILSDLKEQNLIAQDVGRTTFLLKRENGHVDIVYSKKVKNDQDDRQTDLSDVVDLYYFNGIEHDRVVQGADSRYRIYHDQNYSFRVLFTVLQSDNDALFDLFLYENGACCLLVSGVDRNFHSNIVGDQVVYFKLNPKNKRRYLMEVTSISHLENRPTVILSECARDTFKTQYASLSYSHAYKYGNWIEFDQLQNYYRIESDAKKLYHEQFGSFISIKPKTDLYRLYFHKSISKKYYLALELAQAAKEHILMDSIWENDDSENHDVEYSENQIRDLALMNQNISSAIGTGSIASYQIFGINIELLMQSCETFIGTVSAYCSPVTLYTNYIGTIRQDPSFTKYVENVRDRLMVLLQCDTYQELQLHLLNKISRPMWSEVSRSHDKINDYLKETNQNYTDFKKDLRVTEELMILENRLPTRWKSEQELFKLIKQKFPTATMHASPEWLQPQHFDVYVKEEGLAFEYQGVQHFKSVEHFGGVEAFARRLILDENKKKKCKQNQVMLIEWMFNEPLTKDVLKQKLNQIDKHI